MPVPPSFMHVLDTAVEGAVFPLADALQAAREERPVEYFATGTFERLDDAVRGYVQVSETLGDTLVAELSRAPRDDDVGARLCAALGMDLKVAEELAAIDAAVHGSDAPDLATVVDSDEVVATQPFRDALAYYWPLLHDPGQPAPPVELPDDPNPPVTGAADDPGMVLRHTDAILRGGGGVLAATVLSLATPHLGAALGSLVSGAASTAQSLLEGLDGWRNAAARGLIRCLDAAVRKITGLMAGFGAFAEPHQVLDTFGSWFDDLLEMPGGAQLGALLGADELVSEAHAKLRGRADNLLLKVTNDGADVVAHHDEQLRHAVWGNRALQLAGLALPARVAGAEPFLWLSAVAIVLYVVYQTHDHLDARRPAFLPDRTRGIRRAVEEAIA